MTETITAASTDGGDEWRRGLGRWRTGDLGLFTWMDGHLLELVALPLIPFAALGWRDLVLPGTDLAFLGLDSFEGCGVDVGIAGGVRHWHLSGVRTDAGIEGTVVEVARPPAISAPARSARHLAPGAPPPAS